MSASHSEIFDEDRIALADMPGFDRPPSVGLFMPGHHHGFALSQPDAPLFTSVPHANVGSILLTDHEPTKARWALEVEANATRRSLPECLELNTQPAVVEQAGLFRTAMTVNRRWLLSGAGGKRVMTKYVRNAVGDMPKARRGRVFARHFDAAKEMPPPPATDADLRTLPFVLDAKNLTNYYHFMAETFGNMALLDDIPGHRAPIAIHAPGGEPAGFITRFMQTLFPEHVGRIIYPGMRLTYDRAVIPFMPNYYLFQVPDARLGNLPQMIPNGADFHRNWPSGATMQTLAMNSYGRQLRLLRERAIAVVENAKDLPDLPRRFYVQRASTGKRDRTIEGEPKLIAALKERGIEPVYFEKLPPIQQIALMARAELMISYHGAGFTNLIFANSNAHIFEIGTLQSGCLRWNDFISLAHVAGCTYTLGIADSITTTPDAAPPLRGPLGRVDLTDYGMERLLAHIDSLP